MKQRLITAFVIGFVIAWIFGPILARAHEFYDPWCCNETDCAPYHGEVVARPDGYWIPEFQTLVPYNKARVTPWHDEHQFHLCEFPKGSGTVRCFYAKPGGV